MKAGFTAGVIALATLSGCASITGTPMQSVSLQTREQSGTEVSGAACELSNNKGKWYVTTPGSVTIHRSNDDMQVICNKNGYEPGRATVVSETKGSMYGNIILGGGIGALVDHHNGSAYEYPGFVQVIMGLFSKVETQRPSAQADNPTAPASPTVATNSALVATASATSPDQGAQTVPVESKLADLKRLHDSGLITQDIYLERQRKLLDESSSR